MCENVVHDGIVLDAMYYFPNDLPRNHLSPGFQTPTLNPPFLEFSPMISSVGLGDLQFLEPSLGALLDLPNLHAAY